MFPPAPPFTGALRLARLADVPRIGVVAAASFFHSSWFHYERPHFDQYPRDTLSRYHDSFRNAILDPDSVVVVAEDSLDRAEAGHVYGALAEAYPPFEEQIPKEALGKTKAVVPVANFSLLPGSPRHGQFQPPEVSLLKPGSQPPIDDPVSCRDKNPTAGKIMDEVLHHEEVTTFHGRMVIDMMVTHPAYWRRGHATTMTNWIVQLAKQDGTGLGVAGAPMGKVLFGHAGFKEAKTVEIPGYEDHPNPIYAWLGLLDVEDVERAGA